MFSKMLKCTIAVALLAGMGFASGAFSCNNSTPQDAGAALGTGSTVADSQTPADSSQQQQNVTPDPTLPCATIQVIGDVVVDTSSTHTYVSTLTGVCDAPAHSWSITGGCSLQGATNGVSVVVVVGDTPGSCVVTDTVACAHCDTASVTGSLQVGAAGMPVCTITAEPPCANSTGNQACVPDVGPASYTWTISNGTITAGQGTRCITYTAGASGTVHLTVAGNNSTCDCDGTKDVDIKPTPDCTITAVSPCPSSTGNTATVPDAGAGATYAWTISGGTITAGQGTNSITYTAGASGSITITVDVTKNGCSCHGSTLLALAASLNCTITATPPCPNSTGNMACVPDAGANTTYTWTITGGTITAGQGTRCIIFSVGDSGTVVLGVDVSMVNCACPCHGSKELVIAPAPDCTITAAAPCANATNATASVPDAGSGATYAWTVVGGAITAGQGTNSITYTAGASGTVSIAVDVTTGAGCTCHGTKDVTIAPNPDCTITANPPCPDSRDNAASVPDAGAGATYVWTITGGTITGGQGTASITYTANASGTVSLGVGVTTDAGCKCHGTKDLTIGMAPVCTITATPPCPNSTGNTASVADAGSGATYSWTITGGTITAGQGTASITYTANASGTVSLAVDVTSSSGCSCHGTLDVTIGTTPNCTITANAPCPNSQGNVASVADAGSGATYTWTITGGTITSGQGTRTIQYTANASGVVSLAVDVTNASGCSCHGTKDVTIGVTPNCDITAAAPCPNTTGNTASVANAGAGATYAWNITGGSITAGQGTASITYTAGASGTVTINVDVTTAGGCACHGSKTLTIGTTPVCTISASTPCPNSTGNTASVADAGGGATYVWTISGGTITAGQGTASITYTAGATGSVNLAVDVTSSSGCTCHGTLQLTITTVSCTIDSPTQAGIFGGSVTGGVAPFTCLATFATSGWVVDGCAVDSSGNGPGFTITYHRTDGTCNPISPPQVNVTITDHNGCSTQCSQEVPCPPGGCVISGNGTICDNGSTQLCAEASAGTLPPVTIHWTGPGGFTSTDSCINVTVPGIYSATVTDGNGLSNTCCAPVVRLKIKGNAQSPCANTSNLVYTVVSDTSGQGTIAATYNWTITGNGTFCDGTTSATGPGVCVNTTSVGNFTLSATVNALVTFTCDGTSTAAPVSGTCSATFPVVSCP